MGFLSSSFSTFIGRDPRNLSFESLNARHLVSTVLTFRIGVGKALVPGLGAGAFALTAFAAKATYASLRARTLAKDATLASKAIGGISAGLAMGAIAHSAGEAIGNCIVEQRRQYDKIRTEASKEFIRKFRADEE